KTDFLLKQKKTFKFRNKNSELGGDICVTGNLILFGRNYTMFVNADAMGKSMQGAGGAIVMGTAINSIMSRSASNKRNLDLTPEEWLIQTYNEVHNIFLTFDGSMLISCIMGVIDDIDGKMWYFSAEHPPLTLYRDGMSSFLIDELKSGLLKLGCSIG